MPAGDGRAAVVAARKSQLPPLDLKEAKLAQHSKDAPEAWSRQPQGVSVHHLVTVLMEEVLAAGLDRTATVSQVEAHVVRARTKAIRCPRDGMMGLAYADLLQGGQAVGAATHLLSYSSATPIGHLVDALEEHCRGERLPPSETYVWLCCLCLNRNRQEKALDDSAWGAATSRMKSIGRVLALMTPWDQPQYLCRAW